MQSAQDNTGATYLNGGTTDDHLAIQQLVYRYAIALDNLDPVSFRECFAPDAVLQGGGVDLRGETIADELIAMHRRRRESRGVDDSMHQVTNHLFTVQDRFATGTTYCIATQFWNRGGERTKVDLYIKYHDELVKRGARWLFLKRELQALSFTEIPAIDWTLLPNRGSED